MKAARILTFEKLGRVSYYSPRAIRVPVLLEASSEHSVRLLLPRKMYTSIAILAYSNHCYLNVRCLRIFPISSLKDRYTDHVWEYSHLETRNRRPFIIVYIKFDHLYICGANRQDFRGQRFQVKQLSLSDLASDASPTKVRDEAPYSEQISDPRSRISLSDLACTHEPPRQRHADTRPGPTQATISPR